MIGSTVPAAALLAIVLGAPIDPGGGAGKVVSERWYLWLLEGKPCGRYHAVRRETADPKAPVLFVDDFVIHYRGQRMTLHMQTFCRNDSHYTPVRIISKGEGDDELGTFDAKIDWGENEGTLRTRLRGRWTERKLPPKVVTNFALFEVVRRLPFKKGVVFEFHSLEASELNLKRNHRITYLGKEDVHVWGMVRTLHKFEQAGDGISPAQYWVDDKHELVRFLIDGRKETVLTTKDHALKAVE